MKRCTEALDFSRKGGVVEERSVCVEGRWRLTLESTEVSMQT
jgi:hypothetical protein